MWRVISDRHRVRTERRGSIAPTPLPVTYPPSLVAGRIRRNLEGPTTAAILPKQQSLRQFAGKLDFMPQVIFDRAFLFVFHGDQSVEILTA